VITTLSLESAEEKIHSIFNTCFPPGDVGAAAVEGQRNFISGFIFCMLDQKIIEKSVHDILHAMFFEGMCREMAIEMTANSSKIVELEGDTKVFT